jgi:hypothetical protein
MRFDRGQNAVCSRLDFDDGFVGFHFEEDLAFRDSLSFFLHPRNNLSSFLRHLERRHHNASSHNVF